MTPGGFIPLWGARSFRNQGAASFRYEGRHHPRIGGRLPQESARLAPASPNRLFPPASAPAKTASPEPADGACSGRRSIKSHLRFCASPGFGDVFRLCGRKILVAVVSTSRPRWLPQKSLPPYAYLPGRSPHPVRDPAGHSYPVEPIPAAAEAAFQTMGCLRHLKGSAETAARRRSSFIA